MDPSKSLGDPEHIQNTSKTLCKVDFSDLKETLTILKVRKVDFAQRFIGVLYTLRLKGFSAEGFLLGIHREGFFERYLGKVFKPKNL